MATAQDLVTCDICKQEPLQHFCNGCDIRMCKLCVVTHLETGSVEGHTIIPYKYRDVRNIQPGKCFQHPSMIQSLYCRGCLQQICVTCIDEHRGHDLIDLKQFINSQFKEIEMRSDYLKSKILPNGRERIEKIKLILENANREYDQERQKILNVGKDLHRKVDEKVGVLLVEIDNEKKETMLTLQNEIEKTEAKLEDVGNLLKMCEAAKSSLDDVLKFSFNDGSYDMADTVEVNVSRFESQEKSFINVGSLKRSTVNFPTRKQLMTPDRSMGRNSQSFDNKEELDDKYPQAFYRRIKDLLTGSKVRVLKQKLPEGYLEAAQKQYSNLLSDFEKLRNAYPEQLRMLEKNKKEKEITKERKECDQSTVAIVSVLRMVEASEMEWNEFNFLVNARNLLKKTSKKH